MRIVCAIISLLFMGIGVILISLSFNDENVAINAPKFGAAAFGFGLLGFSVIIILLVLILHELKQPK